MKAFTIYDKNQNKPIAEIHCEKKDDIFLIDDTCELLEIKEIEASDKVFNIG